MNKLFYLETIEALERHGHNGDEVIFVTDGIHNCFWLDFVEQLTGIGPLKYDAGYGIVIINLDLKIVGSNWWLERQQYDGKEWWAYKEQPKNPCQPGKLRILEKENVFTFEDYTKSLY